PHCEDAALQRDVVPKVSAPSWVRELRDFYPSAVGTPVIHINPVAAVRSNSQLISVQRQGPSEEIVVRKLVTRKHLRRIPRPPGSPRKRADGAVRVGIIPQNRPCEDRVFIQRHSVPEHIFRLIQSPKDRGGARPKSTLAHKGPHCARVLRAHILP